MKNLIIKCCLFIFLILPILATSLKNTPNRLEREFRVGQGDSAVLEAQNNPNWKELAQISKLIYCESGGNVRALGDSGKAMGILQFWQKTFYDYGKKYEILPEDLEYHETLNRIWEPETQIAVAKAMLINEKDALGHWSNCSKKMKL